MCTVIIQYVQLNVTIHTVTVITLSSTVSVVSNYCLTTVVLDTNLSKLLLNYYSTEIKL